MAPSSPRQARAELEALLASGFDLAFAPQGVSGDRPLRRSAVLILFGVLDDVPADLAVPTVPAGLDVLLQQRSSAMRHHAGQISFPGGGLEDGDDGPVDAALREAAEETGLDPRGVEVLGSLPEVHIPVSNNLVTPVVGWWASPSAVRADQSESVEVRRVPVAELLAPPARGTSVLTRGRYTYRGEAFRLRGGSIVWGFTGIILARLFDGLGWSVPWDAAQEFPVEG